MKLIFLFISIFIITLIILKIFLFTRKGGNWHLIPTNITRAYKTIRDNFEDSYQNNSELLFITGITNAIIYIKKDSKLIEKIYFAAQSCSSTKQEYGMVSDFSQILMNEYFLQDTNTDASEIATAIWNKRHDIDKSVIQELKSNKYNNAIGENTITIAKNYYSELNI